MEDKLTSSSDLAFANDLNIIMIRSRLAAILQVDLGDIDQNVCILVFIVVKDDGGGVLKIPVHPLNSRWPTSSTGPEKTK